jgi:sulfite dehydrogenase (cytochrome) subunit A
MVNDTAWTGRTVLDALDARRLGIGRRDFLRLGAAAVAGASAIAKGRLSFAADTVAGGPTASFPLVKFPEKTDLILLTDRPPNLETPLKYFREDLTPNDAFFVRWHLGIVPTRIDTGAFELAVAGHVKTELSLSLEDLRTKFEPVSIVAVNQCSGNSRSLFAPRVSGGQWGHGACGNAKWTGVRLKDLLAKAGVKAGAQEVTFKGLDKSPAPSVPDFIKSLTVDKANDPDVLVAFAMNDKPLPMLNGFPLRLVVPGWFATYWVKALGEIRATNEPFTGFWMAKAYRVPAKRPLMDETPDALATDTVPISRMLVRSLIVKPEPGEQVKAGQACELDGIAFDGGSGIKQVEVSTDGAKSWSKATLGRDLGKFSFRRWRHRWTPAAGEHTIMARATSNNGETQPDQPKWNRSGYARNVVETLRVTAA